MMNVQNNDSDTDDSTIKLNNDYIKWQQFEEKIEKSLLLLSSFPFLSINETSLCPFASHPFPNLEFLKKLLQNDDT